MYRHSSRNSPGIYWNLTSNSHRAHYLAVSRHFHIRSGAKKNSCEEQSGKFFYHCLETFKGYGNVQTFIKKFAGNLLKFNVNVAQSPIFGRFVHFHIRSRAKYTYAKSNPCICSTAAWKPLNATEIYRHSSKKLSQRLITIEVKLAL